MIYITSFVVSWLIFYIFADRWRIGEYLPTMIFAGFLAISTDIMMLYYDAWTYHEHPPLPDWAVAVILDLGVYAVVAALFIQWLPKKPLFQLLYIIPWTTFAILIELLFLYGGWIQHHNFWTLMHSYIADWVIFYLIIVQYEYYSKGPRKSASSYS